MLALFLSIAGNVAKVAAVPNSGKIISCDGFGKLRCCGAGRQFLSLE